MNIEKDVKILKQGTGSSINIPKIVMQLMKVKAGDKLHLNYDIDKMELTINKQ